MLYGGLPRVTKIDDEKDKKNYLASLYDEMYIKDIVERNSIEREDVLGDILDYLASQIGSLTNPSNVANAISTMRGENINQAMAANYIKHTMDSFLISLAKRYDIKGKAYFNYPNKYYYVDIGLRNARLNYRQFDAGHIMENIIYNELRYRGYQVDVGVVESREKDENGKECRVQREIDFIATLGSKKYYIQSAYAIPDNAKYEQETASFDKAMDSFKKIIIVEKSTKPRRDEKGYVMMGVKEFLLDKNSLEA